MLKPLLISSMLLGGLCLQAQEFTTPKPQLLYGFQIAADFVPIGCPVLNMRHALVLQPGQRYFISIGLDLNVSLSLDYQEKARPSLYLGYQHTLANLGEQWSLRLVFDTKHFVTTKRDGYRTYKEPYYARDYEADVSPQVYEYFEYEANINTGVGATWRFAENFALNLAAGPTVKIGYYQTRITGFSEYNYSYTCIEFHLNTAAGITYIFNRPKKRTES